MKKAFLVLALIAVAVCISITGCSKKCNCKAKINGKVVMEKTVDVEKGKSCRDYNESVTVAGQSVSLKCTMTF